MKGLLLLTFLGLTTSAPQNWPYRDSLMPYRYGYPAQSQYKYLPQIEDDEDVGPYPVGVARQDFVVGSDGQSSKYIYRRPLFENKAWAPNWKIGDRVRPTTDAPTVNVIETGSVAPVIEPTKEPPRPAVTQPPPPPPPRPVGPEQNVGKPVQPPPFPPARPPPTPPAKEEEEEEEDEDDESEEADDEDEDEEEKGDADTEDEDEDEEERRRQEPLSDEDEKVVPSSGVVAQKPAAVVDPPVVVPVNEPVVPDPPAPSSVEEVNVTPPKKIESNEVEVSTKPSEADDESDEEGGLDDAVEALVPGYVTDQGEVLVPVDTVTGDQPISIVPDPYTPLTRGVPLSDASHFRFNSYSNPFYYSDVFGTEIRRQESEESGEATTNHADDEPETGSSNESGPEARNEFMTSFPPSRTPALYAVINSRFPTTTSQEEESYETRQSSGEFGQVMAYRVKQVQQQRPSVSVAVALSGDNPMSQMQSSQQQQLRNPFFPMYSQQVRNNPFMNNNYMRLPVRRNPYPYMRPFASYGPYGPIRKRYPTPAYYGPYRRNPYERNPYINRFVSRPFYSPYEYNGPYGPQEIRRPFYGSAPVRRPVYPRPSAFGGYGPRPIYGPQGYGTAKPVFINRRPGVKPVGQSGSNNKIVVVKKKPVVNKKPTPVVLQDDSPYMYEDPQAYTLDSNESNQSDFVQELHVDPQTVHKSRRAAKMAKKVTKKEKAGEKNKKGETDPLQILKKISSKKS